MRRLIFLTAILALLAATTTGAISEGISFDLPAQASGDITATGEWVVLFLSSSDDLNGTSHWPRAAWTNQTWYPNIHVQQGGGEIGAPVEGPPPEWHDTTDLQAVWDLSHGSAGLFVAAEDIRLKSYQTPLDLSYSATGDNVGEHVEVPDHVLAFWGALMEPENTFSAFRGEGDSARFTLHATGLHSMRWFGFQTSCGEAADCPPGGALWEDPPVGRPEAQLHTWGFSETRVESLSGSLALNGTLRSFIVGGPSMDLEVDGSLRLPLATMASACRACPINETLSLEGALALTHLRGASEGRALATLSGDVLSARVDEAPWLDSPWARGAGVAAAGLAGLAAIKLLLGLLFSRKVQDPLLQERRRRLFDLIRQHPGCTFRELVRRGGLASGTTRHHVNILVRHGLVVEKRNRSSSRLFENHGRYESTWSRVVLLREPAMRQLWDWLRAHPDAAQTDILEGLERIGWSRSTTQNRLRRFENAGLLAIRPQGRRRLYRVRDPEAGGEPQSTA